ncbi:hypothetical protein [Siphonobacter sp. SORGH_AS_1065]|uniref:hypothetical protein n=1 Tax=Siphonobacter sp. SORGH_AS_1065 TaxID=3041795 RepID=UPI00278660DC|nr:hypothetical protein [Siphonobacter sp. SORGH_AS_1065]MDQ1088996.1 hypothetical protein [Siphonobacter sp. SORGH_AS_1065]
MQKERITLKTVLHEIQEAGTTFSLKFRKLDGEISFKEEVKKNPTKLKNPKGSENKKDLNTIQRNMKKAGALLLYDEKAKHTFEVKIELLIEYNGHPIFHNY